MNSPPTITDDKMSVVGFDVGNDNCVIAAVRQGVVHVLHDNESKGVTPARISFSDEQRLVGPSASSLLYPSSTFSDIKDLVLSQPGSSHSVSFRKEEIILTPVHLLAMLLSRLKRISERSLEVPVSKCVISVPSFADQFGRRAYLQAARLAGLETLRLIHDTTATALAYGIYKTDFSNSDFRVVFVDVGHCHTQVSVVAFDSDSFRVLSHAADRRLGGRDFDEILFKHFSEQVKDEYQINVSSNAKASIRLKAECEKVKKDLSANGEASMSIESLMDDKNVKGFIKREEFEMLASGLLERVLLPCKNALSDAGVGVDDVQSVELVGAASRIPAITRILSSFFGKEPSRTLNDSECVARGCAFQCAMLTRGFKIKNYEVHDWLPHYVGLEFEAGQKLKKLLVPKGEPLPSLRIMDVTARNMDFLCGSWTHTDENGEPLANSEIIGVFSSAIETPLCKGSTAVVRVHVDIHGIVSLASPALWLVKDQKNPVSSDASCSNSYSAEPRKVDEIKTSKKSEPAVDSQIKGRSSRCAAYSVNMLLEGGFTDFQFDDALWLEKLLAAQDSLAEDRKDELLAYVYDVHYWLWERYDSFATDTEKEVIYKRLEATEGWLLNEEAIETKSVYDDELLELQKMLEPVVNRFKNEEARPEATRELLQCIADNKLAAESLTTHERDAVFSECDKAEQWLQDKRQLQDSLPKSSDPVLWSHEIKEMTASLDASCKRILKRTEPPSGSN